MKNKRTLLIILSIVLLIVLSGCAIPTDENGATILIDDNTTWRYMFDSEGIFSSVFVYPVAKLMNYFTKNTGSALLGLVLTVVIAYTIISVLTYRNTVNQQKITATQPEIAKIQAKYEGRSDENSRMRQAQEMQQLYAKYKLNPLTNIIGTFMQMPLMIAIWHGAQRSYEVVNGSIGDMKLSVTPLDGIRSGKFGYLIIFLLMVVFQFVSMMLPNWLAQRKAKMEAEKHFRKYVKTPNPAANTAYIMMGVIAFLAFTWPAAMSVYWATSSFINCIKLLVINYFINNKKEKEA